jgi:hypothetical protein
LVVVVVEDREQPFQIRKQTHAETCAVVSKLMYHRDNVGAHLFGSQRMLDLHTLVHDNDAGSLEFLCALTNRDQRKIRKWISKQNMHTYRRKRAQPH